MDSKEKIRLYRKQYFKKCYEKNKEQILQKQKENQLI